MAGLAGFWKAFGGGGLGHADPEWCVWERLMVLTGDQGMCKSAVLIGTAGNPTAQGDLRRQTGLPVHEPGG